PLLTPRMLDRVLGVRDAGAGVLAARRMTDTVKEVDGSGRVARTVERAGLRRAETPQIF
ncbi:MAG: bifunctional 2-C-methyl-D-erythritol 4-phosphate cytidylyltransferase/2-C-methyl-D-erythritol 2,4-cyclodiphosphate synthase, partial [Gammaproteobacteria bacterium]|nr:bifunctional 2-C-methyl-D-erythritol 4-phosphate cytidylyltransferase/2-C-methyl-D-erythritol 2,4-cyclodiphosphate synthase [Gemmatimonadota bacterium]NIU78150.1 bifunctional 2-C-methyl-D-erythritol 4-phosphate cytidylyltransferase/2-C-methyl-D-erythritol 2,4-cyclodiphosphate synthase [Gammaproteobacteria bacterium]NIX21779.1 bifunctional 2-C-methyl-D-erythritol 4-phosphate cytidylyltransferase/2-C-methyl-D-erythritol 2,4-cyclodiphosphate synthase [Actinomycetota bacterium]